MTLASLVSRAGRARVGQHDWTEAASVLVVRSVVTAVFVTAVFGASVPVVRRAATSVLAVGRSMAQVPSVGSAGRARVGRLCSSRPCARRNVWMGVSGVCSNS